VKPVSDLFTPYELREIGRAEYELAELSLDELACFDLGLDPIEVHFFDAVLVKPIAASEHRRERSAERQPEAEGLVTPVQHVDVDDVFILDRIDSIEAKREIACTRTETVRSTERQFPIRLDDNTARDAKIAEFRLEGLRVLSHFGIGFLTHPERGKELGGISVDGYVKDGLEPGMLAQPVMNELLYLARVRL
jgi:hypothetical protein